MNKSDFISFLNRYEKAFPNQEVKVRDLAKQIPQHTILEPHSQPILNVEAVGVVSILAQQVLIVYETLSSNHERLLAGIASIDGGIEVGGYLGLLQSKGWGDCTAQALKAAQRFADAKNEFYRVLRILIDVLSVYVARDQLDMGWTGSWYQGNRAALLAQARAEKMAAVDKAYPREAKAVRDE